MNRKNVRTVANALLLAQGKHPVGYNQHIFAGPATSGVRDMTGHACGSCPLQLGRNGRSQLESRALNFC